jgi:radical SAM superfamily enzyme YgiQ (UPF0313 family)
MEMKIVLIVTPMMDFNSDGRLEPIEMDKLRANPNYGMYLLAAVLKNQGYQVVILDLIARGSLDITAFEDDIADSSLVAIGGTSFSWPSVCDVIAMIRQIRKDVPIVLGGIHPTMFDRYLLRKLPVQYIIRGESEVALPSLCARLIHKQELTRVPNLSWLNDDGQIICNPVAPGISGEELGALPVPDYDRIPLRTYHYLPIESSRGCLHDCSFCSTPYRRSWRFIAPEIFVDRLAETMKFLHRTVSGQIQIVDDEFSINPERAMKIAALIKEKGLKPSLRFCSRVKDVLVDGFAAQIAGVTGNIFLGAECGYDEGLTYAGKGITCKHIELAARRLQEHGINGKATFSFIIGLPWETKRDVERTVRFVFYLIDHFGITVTIQWYIQIPGSHLWHQARKDQLFNEAMYDNYNFIHNAYMFRGELQLKPTEIWEINDMILNYPNPAMITYNTPEALIRYFPKELFDEEGNDLANLRELALSVRQ